MLRLAASHRRRRAAEGARRKCRLKCLYVEVSFEVLPKTKKVNLRFPAPLLEAVLQNAKQEGISHQKYIRRSVERLLTAQQQQE